MEKIKYMFMAVLVALVSMTVTSCGDDDDDENVSNQKNPASMIVGTYAGTLRQPGDNTDGSPCYVAFERLSNTTVMLTRFICEDYGFDQEKINFKVSESNGVYKLNSERSLAIEGMYINGVLTITFQTEGGTTWIFNGKKEK
ncbi:hypothetical protein [Leyella stercorea]|uniref:hypothetical protein n=1 Tax=Leyella stercorea TaxID=363265 RepID=UPI003F7F2413